MAKNHQTDNPLYKALAKKYEAQIAAAYATLIIYFDNSVGIGEHTDLLSEVKKWTESLSQAEENLQVLRDNFDMGEVK